MTYIIQVFMNKTLVV